MKNYDEMQYNWENASARAQAAKEHTERMAAEFWEEIRYSAVRAKVYDGNVPHEPKAVRRRCNLNVMDKDSVSALFSYANGKTAILNFASYKNAGGKFLQGSRAQEECLCHESTLYNVLSKFDDGYYRTNRAALNNGLYLNQALYTPEVVFVHGDSLSFGLRKRYCDVITCAAPNKSAASYRFSGEELAKRNTEALKSRIEFVLNIAEDNRVDTLILGAYGCGVFGQDPTEVAEIFQDCLKSCDFRQVVFAIPSGKNENLKAFKNVFR